jgi:hypothetical protein
MEHNTPPSQLQLPPIEIAGQRYTGKEEIVYDKKEVHSDTAMWKDERCRMFHESEEGKEKLAIAWQKATRNALQRRTDAHKEKYPEQQ